MFQKLKNKLNKNISHMISRGKNGFSIIEVILAGALLAIIVFGIVSAWLYGEHALIKAGDSGRGIAIASEGIELTRNLRDIDFGSLQDGTYALTNTGSTWTLTPNEKEAIGSFFRTITIVSDGISRKNITSTATWNNVDGTPGSISSSTVLSNWQQLKKNTKKNSPLVITNVVADPADTSVVVTWNTNKAASTRVEIGTTASYGSMFDAVDLDPMVTSHSYPIQGLAQLTTYHFRVISRDATGATAYSLDSTFVTAPDTTSPVISNVVVSAFSNWLVIEWDTDEASSTYMDYGITGQSQAPTTPTQFNVMHHTLLEYNLLPETEYTFVLHSADVSGNIASTSQATFMTLGTMPAIFNIVVQTISATFVTVSWDTDVLTDGKIINNDSPEQVSPVVDTSPMTTSHSAILSGLTPCTTYTNIIVQSYNAGGTFSNEGVTQITTKGCPPSVLSNTQSQISNISRIAVMPYQSGDNYSCVFAINSQTGRELSVFAINSNREIESEAYYDSTALESWGIGGAFEVLSLRNLLYIVSNEGRPQVKIFHVDSTCHITYVGTFDNIVSDTATSAFIKEMLINGTMQYVLFIGEAGKVYPFSMQTSDGLSNLYQPDNWTAMNSLALPNPKGPPTDLYVSQVVGGSQWLYAVTMEYLYATDIYDGTFVGNSFEGTAISGSWQPQVTGNENHELVFTSGTDWLKSSDLGSTPTTTLPTQFVKAISKTSSSGGYTFANSDYSTQEFDMFQLTPPNTVEGDTYLDLSGYFNQQEDYGTGTDGTIGYLELNNLIFYSKRNKILIIDTGLW